MYEPRVLHIEDDPNWQKACRDLLKHQYRLETVADYGAAYDLLLEADRSKDPFCAVILDWHFEGSNDTGRDIIAYLRRFDYVKIIVLSGTLEAPVNLLYDTNANGGSLTIHAYYHKLHLHQQRARFIRSLEDAALQARSQIMGSSSDAVGDVAVSIADIKSLRKLMSQNFSSEELQDIAFDLDIDYDSLPEEGSKKVRGLIEYCKRRGRLEQLVGECEIRRKNVNWR